MVTAITFKIMKKKMNVHGEDHGVQSHMFRPTITDMQHKYCGNFYDIYPIESQYTKVVAYGRHHKRGGAAFGCITSFLVSCVLALNAVNIAAVCNISKMAQPFANVVSMARRCPVYQCPSGRQRELLRVRLQLAFPTPLPHLISFPFFIMCSLPPSHKEGWGSPSANLSPTA